MSRYSLMMMSDDSDNESVVSDVYFSDDDEDMLIREVFYPRLSPKNQNYIEEVVSEFGDEQFVEFFRISRRVTRELILLYENSPDFHHQAGPYGKLSAQHRVLIFLWYCGHQTASFRDVADRFDVSLSTVEDIIVRMTLFLSNLSPSVIKWPTADEMEESRTEFGRKGMPGAIGAIDGTHIRVDKPEEDPESYFNRKDFYSVQAQVVCDHRRKIIDFFAGFPGSVHDARAYRNSDISNTLREKCGAYFILADSAYPCLYNLLTPFRDRGHLTDEQKRFNAAFSKCRVIVEHTIGLWKQKFRQLYHLKLRNMEVIIHFIRACAVLHNLALDDDFVPPENVVDPSSRPSRRLPTAETEILEDATDGIRRRNQLFQYLNL